MNINFNKFFKIDFPNNDTIIVIGKRGYINLINLVDFVKDKDNTYITQISFFDLIKYIFSKKW